jgi:hypothetical protein
MEVNCSELRNEEVKCTKLLNKEVNCTEASTSVCVPWLRPSQADIRHEIYK